MNNSIYIHCYSKVLFYFSLLALKYIVFDMFTHHLLFNTPAPTVILNSSFHSCILTYKLIIIIIIQC